MFFSLIHEKGLALLNNWASAPELVVKTATATAVPQQQILSRYLASQRKKPSTPSTKRANTEILDSGSRGTLAGYPAGWFGWMADWLALCIVVVARASDFFSEAESFLCCVLLSRGVLFLSFYLNSIDGVACDVI